MPRGRIIWQEECPRWHTIKVNKGIGSVNVNGKGLSDGEEYGNGTNYIIVNGGIGKIDIKSNNK